MAPSEDDDPRFALLGRLVPQLKAALGEALLSVVLFGSAAEDRLRVSSDVNLLLVLRRWERAGLDGLREPLRNVRAAIQLQPMIVLESELPQVVEAFAVKFADIARRHRVLAGEDVSPRLAPSRRALWTRCRQELLNLQLRLRERYVALSLRPEQAERALAQSAGALRACAAAVQGLRGVPFAHGRAALTELAGGFGPQYAEAVAALSRLREGGVPGDHSAAEYLLSLSELAGRAVALLNELEP